MTPPSPQPAGRTVAPPAGRAPWLVTGVVSCAAWAGLLAVSDLRARPVVAVALLALASLAYLAAARRLLADEAAGRPWALGGVLVVGLLCRALALPTAPSDDVARYVWEARVLAAGHNPYRLAPDDPALAGLARAAPEHGGINHPDWPAIYPPTAQLWQAAVGAASPTTGAQTAGFLIAEAGLVAALLALLRRRGLHASRLLLYAWNPLAVLATAGEGHNDVLATALLVAALALHGRGRGAVCGALFGAAVLAKGFALVALPAFFVRNDAEVPASGPRVTGRGRATFVAAGVVTGAALCAPFLALGGGLTDSLARFGREMHFNDSLHALARALLPTSAVRPSMLAVAAAVALVLLRRRPRDPVHVAAGLTGTLLLVLPTVHPWYLVALLPFLAVFPWWGWIVTSCCTFLTLLPHLEMARTGRWVEWSWVRWAEYAPLALWFAWLACRPRRPASPADAAAPT